MPEMPDVIPGEEIESTWGNGIRDRTIQRYASSAGRTSEHPTPSAGDLSFLEDTGLVYIYYDGAWTPVGGTSEMVDAHASLSENLTASYANVDALSIPIPAYWNSWKCVVWGSWIPSSASPTTYGIRWSIDGTTSHEITVLQSGGSGEHAGHIGRRTGMTTTGSRTVSLQGKYNGAVVVSLLEGIVYAQAWRTS